MNIVLKLQTVEPFAMASRQPPHCRILNPIELLKQMMGQCRHIGQKQAFCYDVRLRSSMATSLSFSSVEKYLHTYYSSVAPSQHCVRGFVVQIIRKSMLPNPSELPVRLRVAAAEALRIPLREPRTVGFPILFSSQMKLIEPALQYLHEHGIQRGYSIETVRTYAEILYDWFETLEQNSIDWADADAVDLVAYRNRMMLEPSGHTRRPYLVSIINHRVRGVLRFYEWAVQKCWLSTSNLCGLGRRIDRSREGTASWANFTFREIYHLFKLIWM